MGDREMTHPSDHELEAMAVKLTDYAMDQLPLDAAAMLRACKGVIAAPQITDEMVERAAEVIFDELKSALRDYDVSEDAIKGDPEISQAANVTARAALTAALAPDVRRLEAENARLRDVLGWYANLPQEWTVQTETGLTYGDLKLIGEKARTALATQEDQQ